MPDCTDPKIQPESPHACLSAHAVVLLLLVYAWCLVVCRLVPPFHRSPLDVLDFCATEQSAVSYNSAVRWYWYTNAPMILPSSLSHILHITTTGLIVEPAVGPRHLISSHSRTFSHRARACLQLTGESGCLYVDSVHHGTVHPATCPRPCTSSLRCPLHPRPCHGKLCITSSFRASHSPLTARPHTVHRQAKLTTQIRA